jgi:hypothetical protein
MYDILDVIKNIDDIYENNTSLAILKDFERVLDEMDMYVYENWEDGELAYGPQVDRHWITAGFMWPREKMPNPIAAKRLTDYGCRINYSEEEISKVRKIRTPGDIRPGTRKGKIDHEDIWLVKINMPKKLMNDINRGYKTLDKNKVDDILNQGGVVSQQVDQAATEQEEANAEQPAG